MRTPRSTAKSKDTRKERGREKNDGRWEMTNFARYIHTHCHKPTSKED